MTTLQFSLVGNEDGSKNLTVFREGDKPLACTSDHINFDAIMEGLIKDDERILDLFDVGYAIGSKFEKLTERISVLNGKIYFDGEEIDNSLTEQILRFLQEGVEDWKPLVNFYENLAANPNQEAVTALYDWIQSKNLTITENGMIVGYKGLLKNTDGNGYGYKSQSAGKAIVDGVVFEGQIPQGVGAVVEMPRSDVDFNPRQDCGEGLHVGSHSYALTYAKPGFFEVHVNPRDVISVPSYGNKFRCCRYVVAKVTDKGGPITKPVVADAKRIRKPKGDAGDVRPGDVYEDTDPRRPRKLKVKSVSGRNAFVENTSTGKLTKLGIDRLLSRFKRTKRGRL